MARSKRDGIAELHARRDDRDRRSGRGGRPPNEWIAQAQEALETAFSGLAAAEEALWDADDAIERAKAATGHQGVDGVHPRDAREEA